jgi:transcriptional regulator with XRE-family HTH domain
MSENWREVGNNLKRLRKEQGWTQEDLSQRSGVSVATIRNAEHAAGRRSRRTMEGLSRALAMPANYLGEVLSSRQPMDEAEAELVRSGVQIPVNLLDLLDIKRGAALRTEAAAVAARVAHELSEGMTQAERIAVHQFLTEVADAVRWPRWSTQYCASRLGRR